MCYLERVLRYGPTCSRTGAFYLSSRLAITCPKSCRERAQLSCWWRWGQESPLLPPLLGQPLEGTEAQGLGSFLLKKFPQRGHLCRPAARSAFHPPSFSFRLWLPPRHAFSVGTHLIFPNSCTHEANEMYEGTDSLLGAEHWPLGSQWEQFASWAEIAAL